MSGRLVVVSNRVAVPGRPRAPSAGGMAVAVKAALKNRDAVWFGWSGEVAEAARAETRTVRVNNVDYVFFDLTSVDIQEYYSGFANNVLWPVLHYRVDLQQYSRLDASGYLRVNRLFADRLSPLLEEDDVVWVHDYHLMPLARELRSRDCHNAIGFFLHAPCAPPGRLASHAEPRPDSRQSHPLRSRRFPDGQRPGQFRAIHGRSRRRVDARRRDRGGRAARAPRRLSGRHRNAPPFSALHALRDARRSCAR